MTPETTTKFGIYGGQFIPETLMDGHASQKRTVDPEIEVGDPL
jgi:tryptophan synthase beta subunit